MKTFKSFALAALLVAGTASASPPTFYQGHYSIEKMKTALVLPAALSAALTDVKNITIVNRAWTDADLFLLDAPPDMGWRTTSTEMEPFSEVDFSVSSTAVMWMDPDVGTSASVIKCFNVNDVNKMTAQSGLYQVDDDPWNTNGDNRAPNFAQMDCDSNLNSPAELSARTSVPQPVRLVGYWPRE